MSAKESVTAQFVGKDGGINGRIHDGFRHRPVGAGLTLFVAPFDRIVGHVAEWRLRAARIGEDVAGMIEHDIEDNVDAGCMRVVHEVAQFGVRVRLVRHEPRVDLEEILNTIAVVGASGRGSVEELAILQYRRQPDRTHAQ